jgi:hypothetical protein
MIPLFMLKSPASHHHAAAFGPGVIAVYGTAVHDDPAQGQVVTKEKSKGNEVSTITAIPQLLDLIDIRGDVVTIDAMGCQTAIAEKRGPEN